MAESAREKMKASNEFRAPIVTEIKPLDQFYTAEEYHQRYYERNENQPYCQVVITPKVKKLLEKYGKFVKSEAA
jgi:peptide-methionine (S)-S-oxide reductase